jgi:hypothetical protein
MKKGKVRINKIEKFVENKIRKGRRKEKKEKN